MNRWKLVLRMIADLMRGRTEAHNIHVYGARIRRERVAEALRVLSEQTPVRLQWLLRHIGVIVVSAYSYVDASDKPPVGVRISPTFVDRAAPYQVAAWLCHEARHCEFYWLAKERAGGATPSTDSYREGTAERDCAMVEADVLRELGAGSEECSWVLTVGSKQRDAKRLPWEPQAGRTEDASGR